MQNLKSSILSALSFLVLSCSTKDFYKVEGKGDSPVAIITTPERFLPYCELANDEGLYGFMVLILDEEKTVLATGFRTSNKKGCEDWKKGVSRVLSSGRKIKLVGTGDIEIPRSNRDGDSYSFPGLGTFPGNDRVLQLRTVTNENGGCFGMFTINCGSEAYP